MSIASEITRLQNAKAALKTSINAKNDQQHQITTETIDDYADFVDAIQTGGGGSTGDYKVTVIDYDGTVLDEKYLNNGDTYTIPTAPTHDRLTFSRWASSEPISNGTVTVNNQDIMIGPLYYTTSGLTEFDICLTSYTGLSFTLNMSGTKNWGDGTSDTASSHTYSDYGEYTITCTGTSLTGTSSSGGFGQSSSNPNTSVISVRWTRSFFSAGYGFQYCYALKSISSEKTLSSGYAFRDCFSLKGIVISNSSGTIAGNSFDRCYNLQNIVIETGITKIENFSFSSIIRLLSISLPNTITYLGSNNFSACYQVERVKIPPNIVTFGSGCFYNSGIKSFLIPSIQQNEFWLSQCYNLLKLKFPNAVTRISSGAFASNVSILEYDFTDFSSVPTLSAVSAFAGINPKCKIKVPSSLYNSWTTATNWVTFASYIESI